MSLGTPAITNFTAGEWSPKLFGRVDLTKYGQACSELLNMTILPHGAVTRRMGTEFAAKGLSADVRLIPFIYNEEQAYVLEFTPGKIRFFRNGGLLPAATLTTSYTAGEIAELSHCQSADVMYLACKSRAVQKLSRPGQDSFTLAGAAFASPPSEWRSGNYPCAVSFHQQRLWAGGTPAQAQKIWASKVGDLENFQTGTDEDMGLAYSLISEQVNAVRWIKAQRVLLIGTSGGEWKIGADGAAITNKNISVDQNSNYGTSSIAPVLAGTTFLQVAGDGRRLRNLGYDFGRDAYLSQDVSLLAEHLTRPGIKAIAYCQYPDSIVWTVLEDGGLAGLTFLEEQEVAGWHRHRTAGKVLSVCCIPGAGHTETWLAVERANGVCIERMQAPWDGESTNEPGCWFVDCGLLYEGEPVRKLAGLDHLEGQEVEILADGAAHPRRIVQAGAIDLEDAAGRVLVGLPYEWALTPMRLEGLSERGTMQGKRAYIPEVMARLYKSLGVRWERAGQSDAPYPLADRDVDMRMDAAPTPFTGDAIMPMPGGWKADSRVRLSGRGAFPATIIMLAPKVAVNE